MYIILFEKLLAPNENVPLDYLFPWCYKVILNLVREESRKIARNKRLIEELVESLSTPSLMEDLIEKEKEIVQQAKLEKVLDILYSDGAGLSTLCEHVSRSVEK